METGNESQHTDSNHACPTKMFLKVAMSLTFKMYPDLLGNCNKSKFYSQDLAQSRNLQYPTDTHWKLFYI